jgi:hypothetical protein
MAPTSRDRTFLKLSPYDDVRFAMSGAGDVFAVLALVAFSTFGVRPRTESLDSVGANERVGIDAWHSPSVVDCVSVVIRRRKRDR